MYKVHILDNMGNVEHIFVFCAGYRSSDDINELFSDIELAHHKAHNIDVKFSSRLKAKISAFCFFKYPL